MGEKNIRKKARQKHVDVKKKHKKGLHSSVSPN
jgi:hypothetical protein